MNDWTIAKVIEIKKWKNNLFSLILNASIYPFVAGQFSRISYLTQDGKKIQKAYSYVNAPKDRHLEFYITLIPNGQLTPYLYKLSKTDKIMIKRTASGFFTLNEIPSCKNLWMFATGTGIGPYLSILKDKNGTHKFENIILVHAVRYYDDLTYLSLMSNLKQQYKRQLHIQTIISREVINFSLCGRIPKLLENNKLENTLGFKINKDTCHVMLCGNPSMVKDTQEFLIKNRNMKKHLRKKHGQITSENYW
ncbi:FAD-binding oxidoreductase [Buchnera aphidicola]|uniref:Flavodoxin/ferredoxin--NADP reductase n=2 Tax=Buchnera aphidicola TaxID=9 RepID=A0A4D6Y212_BUCMH|nr:FAD-binding oxidoreductase [Buchnera aphidicola]QCI23536.1 ferredoxin--NADP(+) reductase [Buchnera aphidicola (Melaphis rhois)]